MPDWTAEDIAREIERRRGGGGRRATIRERSAEDQMCDWNDADWAKAFERRHGFKANPRWGRTRVRVLGSDGAILFDNDVHVFHLTGQAHPWRGYAWCANANGKNRFISMVGDGDIKSPLDAVRAWLGELAL